MATYHLHRWSVGGEVDPYLPPESQVIRLTGFRDQDTRAVTTSPIIEVNGREVTTYSGSVYILEDIDPDYLEFLDKRGEIFDPENPIRIKDI